ncbi:MAG TPA: glucuronate isomerase [Candidatus Lokiarchaeia archaeon]|nr:glucuronate isomerase [Candidatus Lokiarchaeia archaeon]
MATFLGDDYLLTNQTSKKIFSTIKALPIIDAHNHANVKEIAENKNYKDIWQVEAATDHYVWELMRKRGVPEQLITGDATNDEKWMALAGVFEEFIGNPVFEWIHLDLQRRFGITKCINDENAQAIWDETMAILARPEMRPQAILKSMNVEVMCSTDDPIDILEYHESLAKKNNTTRILPTWRPDKAMNIFKKDYPEYIKKLESRVGMKIDIIGDLVKSLQMTHDYFAEHGCKASDHGIMIPFGHAVPETRANEIFAKRLGDEDLAADDVHDFIGYMMNEFARMDAGTGWVMQVHIGAIRDYRDSLFEMLGPDSGGDISDHSIPIVEPLRTLLNANDGQLKMLLYSLDPSHAPTLATIARAYGKDVNIGAAWWFNDSPIGMRRQLEYIGTVDLLSNFGGMVTDSRKLVSYSSRTEMFRRVLADVLGGMVEHGQIPEMLALRLAKKACYGTPKLFFGF